MEIVIKGGSSYTYNIRYLRITSENSVPTTSDLFLKGFRILKLTKDVCKDKISSTGR